MTAEKYQRFGLLILIALLCSACGAHIIRGASPIVQMNELSHEGKNLSLQLSMRNLNGVELIIHSIDFSLSVEENVLFTYEGPAETTIAANGTETWAVEVEESDSGRTLLEKLQSGDINSLPYALEGSIKTADDGTLRFEYEGHIYPVPGRPGRFR